MRFPALRLGGGAGGVQGCVQLSGKCVFAHTTRAETRELKVMAPFVT